MATLDVPNTPPDCGDLARQVMGAMVVAEPVPGVGWAIAYNEDKSPIYIVTVVLGTQNVLAALPYLQRMQKEVIIPADDIFDDEGTPPTRAGVPPKKGIPATPTDAKKRRRRRRRGR